ncbi:TPA: hypothetical protein ACH3X2_010528 [Trebouxia sp. C0005]
MASTVLQVTTHHVSVSMQLRHEPSLVTFGSNGRGQDGGYIEFDPDETRGRLEIIVQSGSRTVAGGVIPVEELWQLAKAPARPCYSPQRTKPKTHSLVDKLARAFSGQSIAESEPLYGNIWVYVTDQNGRRYSLSVCYFTQTCTRLTMAAI